MSKVCNLNSCEQEVIRKIFFKTKSLYSLNQLDSENNCVVIDINSVCISDFKDVLKSICDEGKFRNSGLSCEDIEVFSNILNKVGLHLESGLDDMIIKIKELITKYGFYYIEEDAVSLFKNDEFVVKFSKESRIADSVYIIHGYLNSSNIYLGTNNSNISLEVFEDSSNNRYYNKNVYKLVSDLFDILEEYKNKEES